jgi:putative Mg2+ transporter-C (MgtC) family protein
MQLGDLTLQLELAVRLLVAAVLGAAIGFEREIHQHPAGMRTHLLVSVGAAIFTELSIFGFASPDGSAPIDPSRVAAQVVSGIGFLGAGAILKYGTSIRGLTTAASLWAAAAIGMAAGAGAWVIGAVGAVIVIFSLWPLSVVIKRLELRDERSLRVRLALARLEALGEVSRILAVRRVEIGGISTERLGKGRYEVELLLHLPTKTTPDEVITSIGTPEAVEVLDSQVGTD